MTNLKRRHPESIDILTSQLAEKVSDINIYLRTVAKTLDFFQGYSLSEAIQDRIDDIGPLDGAKRLFTDERLEGAHRFDRNPRHNAPTKQAELLYLEEVSLLIIEEARETLKLVDTYKKDLEKINPDFKVV